MSLSIVGLLVLAVATPSALPPEIDAYLAKAVEDWEIPGMAVAVVHRGRVTAKAYGVRSLDRPEPIDLHTIFDTASISKSFTATLVAMLVDDGKLAWDEPVKTYLPRLDLGDPYLTANATLRDFLSHRTGLAPGNALWKLTARTRPEIVDRLRCVPRGAPFRTTQTYSNLGYTVVGEAIEAVGGASWEELMRRRILEPLELRDSVADYDEAMRRPNHAEGHTWRAGAQRALRPETRRAGVAPAASVMASIADMARWCWFHLGGGELDGKRPVSAATLRETQSPQVIIPTTPEMRKAREVELFGAYGMGWNVMDFHGHPLLWHTGSGDGQMAYVGLLPADDLAVVVLINTWAAGFIHVTLASWLFDAYLGFETRDRSGEARQRHLASLSMQPTEGERLLATAAAGAPPRPLASYAGTYEACAWGPIHVRLEAVGLTLQFGEGDIADLRYHDGDRFVTVWRDPLYRAERMTLVELSTAEDGTRRLKMTIWRDEIEAVAPK